MYYLEKVFDYLFDADPCYTVSGFEFADTLEKAAMGDVASCFSVGRFCETGNGMDRDELEAFYWYSKASSLGHAEATGALGDCYYYGRGTEKDREKAVKFYELALERMDDLEEYPYMKRSLTNFANCLLSGDGTEKDPERAVKYYKMAGRYAPAEYALGSCCENGEGTARNITKAVIFYKRAARKNHSGACYRLGKLYLEGKRLKRDVCEAVNWFEKALLLGHAGAGNDLGVCLIKNSESDADKKRAFELFLDSWERGAERAGNNLALCYENGIGTEKDGKKAFGIYKYNARELFDGDGGNTDAMFFLGRCYENGIGTAQSYSLAAKWYGKAASSGHEKAKKALERVNEAIERAASDGRPEAFSDEIYALYVSAENGDAEACLKLGDVYYNGEGAERDYPKAFAYYKKAAESGVGHAQAMLGECYYYEYGVPEDEDKAFEWYKKAAENGDARGLYEMSRYIYHGSHGIEKDDGKAWEYLNLAAEKGDIYATYRLGEYYMDGKHTETDFEKAEKWLKKSAEADYPYAFIKLSELYFKNEEYEKSVEWFEKTDKFYRTGVTWISSAYYEAGRLYEYEDFEKAFRLYRKSAKNAYREKEYEYSRAILSGGSYRDVNMGVRDYAKAMEKLADAYLYGKSVAPNTAMAAEWYREAKANGASFACVILETKLLWKGRWI